MIIKNHTVMCDTVESKISWSVYGIDVTKTINGKDFVHEGWFMISSMQ